jgi:hypothetical protein
MATRNNDRTAELRDRPIGEVASQLMTDVSTLVRQEVELAKAEMAQKGRTAATGLGMLGAAGVVGLAAAGALTAFLILLLNLWMPAWVAALVVGVALAAIAALVAWQGKEKVEDAGKPVPEQTIESTKEDVEWAETRAKSARR